jgi:hypothetical protein
MLDLDLEASPSLNGGDPVSPPGAAHRRQAAAGAGKQSSHSVKAGEPQQHQQQALEQHQQYQQQYQQQQNDSVKSPKASGTMQYRLARGMARSSVTSPPAPALQTRGSGGSSGSNGNLSRGNSGRSAQQQRRCLPLRLRLGTGIAAVLAVALLLGSGKSTACHVLLLLLQLLLWPPTGLKGQCWHAGDMPALPERPPQPSNPSLIIACCAGHACCARYACCAAVVFYAYVAPFHQPASPVPVEGQHSQFTLLCMSYEARMSTLRHFMHHYSRCPSVSDILLVWNHGGRKDACVVWCGLLVVGSWCGLGFRGTCGQGCASLKSE